MAAPGSDSSFLTSKAIKILRRGGGQFLKQCWVKFPPRLTVGARRNLPNAPKTLLSAFCKENLWPRRINIATSGNVRTRSRVKAVGVVRYFSHVFSEARLCRREDRNWSSFFYSRVHFYLVNRLISSGLLLT